MFGVLKGTIKTTHTMEKQKMRIRSREEKIVKKALSGRFDEPGNKVVADANYDEETGRIEVWWQCDKDNCNCVGSWSEQW